MDIVAKVEGQVDALHGAFDSHARDFAVSLHGTIRAVTCQSYHYQLQ